MKLIVGTQEMRIDKYIAGKLSKYSRGYFQKLIKSGGVTVNRREVSSHYITKEADEIELDLREVERPSVEAQDIRLEILFEDDDVLVLNKEPGIVVHPACGHHDGTLLNALYGHAKGSFSPLLVHRLDKDTSGVLVVAKNERAKKSLAKQFQNRTIKKVYLAAVKGRIGEEKGRIEAPLGRAPGDRQKIVVGPAAKKAGITEFKVLKRHPEFTAIEVYPLTGRTHQIRSHMVYIGHPVLGDKTYGGLEKIGDRVFSRQMLHARRISFTHPATGRRVEFEAPVPRDMKGLFDEEPKGKNAK